MASPLAPEWDQIGGCEKKWASLARVPPPWTAVGACGQSPTFSSKGLAREHGREEQG